ncbi:MAG: response regulator [Azospirillaceae bacterium]|nr:response regulator [Azospirillaceae bacterium]
MVARTQASIFDCAILVVDDTEFNRSLIAAMLRRAGFTRIHHATDGVDALQQIAESPPDLVILDIMMPGINGFEVCRRLRGNPAYADLPVLVQTALSDSEDRNRAFAEGTTDLITKPIDRNELVARVRIHLENRRLIRDLKIYRARLEAELALVRDMFEHLLPDPEHVDGLLRRCGIRLRSMTRFGADLGGSVWGLAPLAEGGCGLWLLEMRGAGVTMALNAFRMHTLINDRLETVDDPIALLREVHDGVGESRAPDDPASMLLARLTPDGGIVLVVSGGNPPLLRRRSSGVTNLDIVAGAVAGEGRVVVDLAPGEWLLLYSGSVATDGQPVPRGEACQQWAALVDRAAGATDADDGSLSRIVAALESAGAIAAGRDICLLMLERL